MAVAPRSYTSWEMSAGVNAESGLEVAGFKEDADARMRGDVVGDVRSERPSFIVDLRHGGHNLLILLGDALSSV